MCRLALIRAGYSRRKWGETASRVAGERITVLRHAWLRAASIPPPAKRWGHRARCLFPSPTKNGGGIRNTVARPCRSNGSSSRGALATKQSMFPLRLDGSSLALAMTVQNKPRRRLLSLPTLRGGGIRGSEFAARRPRRFVVLLLQGRSRERRGAATRNPTGRRN
jgi:hypothetical protein